MWLHMPCAAQVAQPGIGVAGSYNVSLHWEGQLQGGESAVQAQAYQYDAAGLPYAFQLHALISSITPAVGSTAGGVMHRQMYHTHACLPGWRALRVFEFRGAPLHERITGMQIVQLQGGGQVGLWLCLTSNPIPGLRACMLFSYTHLRACRRVAAHHQRLWLPRGEAGAGPGERGRGRVQVRRGGLHLCEAHVRHAAGAGGAGRRAHVGAQGPVPGLARRGIRSVQHVSAGTAPHAPCAK